MRSRTGGLFEKWSAVGSLNVTYFGPLSSFQLYGPLHHDWWSLFTRAGRFDVLSCPFGLDVLSHSTRGLCSFISHWSLHDPFVEFRKFVTPTIAVETPKCLIFLFYSYSYSNRIRPGSDFPFPVTNRVIRCIIMVRRFLCVFVFMVTVVCAALVVAVNVDVSHVPSVISSHEVLGY